MAKRKAAGAKKKNTKTARKAVRKAPRTVARKAAARKGAARKGTARKAGSARKATARKATARKAAPRKAARSTTPKAKAAPIRRAPSLDRERRTIQGDDIVPTPPSSLNLDRHATAARSGRRQMHDRLTARNETSPALTAGDVDADWESAATV